MDSFSPLEISASGLQAQRMRMTAISSNLANVNTTRTEEGGPYQRRDVAFTAASFDSVLDGEIGASGLSDGVGADTQKLIRGVEADAIIDDSPARMVHMPEHPDADENGLVAMPDISVIKEMANMMTASRSYEANLAAIRSTVQMIERAVQIGLS